MSKFEKLKLRSEWLINKMDNTKWLTGSLSTQNLDFLLDGGQRRFRKCPGKCPINIRLVLTEILSGNIKVCVVLPFVWIGTMPEMHGPKPDKLADQDQTKYLRPIRTDRFVNPAVRRSLTFADRSPLDWAVYITVQVFGLKSDSRHFHSLWYHKP